MTKRRVRLTFPPESVTEPIIYNISQQFKLVTNIRQANVTEDGGWIILELEGKGEDIETGIAWVISRGVRVEQVDEEIAET